MQGNARERPKPVVGAKLRIREPGQPADRKAAPAVKELAAPKPVPVPPPAQPLALNGPADQMAAQFLSASPSAMAATQGRLAGAVNARLAKEQLAEAAGTAPLQASAEGGAAPAVIAPILPVGGGTDAGTSPVAVEPDKPTTQAQTPLAAATNAAQSNAVDQAPKPSLWEAFKAWISGVVTQITTRDAGLTTGAGPAEKVALSGSSDPKRAQEEAAATHSAADREQARQQTAFQTHPGQGRVQPVAIRAKAPVSVATDPHARLAGAPDPDMAAFAKAPLPAEVRAHVDAKLAPSLGAKLAPHRQQVSAARQTRDKDRRKALDAARRSAQGEVTKADGLQRSRVLTERRKIAAEQGRGMAEAQAQATALKRDADSRSTAVQGDVAGIVSREEGRAQSELRKGEQKAETERRKGEAEAKGLKAGLKAKTAKKSWWGRLKSAVKSAVKAVTKAIDAVFTRVRKAVSGIIKAARDAAIGIINKARKAITRALDGFRNWAKRQVTAYLGKLAPGLARRVNKAIDGLADGAIKAVNVIADGAVKAVNAVADGLGKALDKVLQVFQTALTTGLNVAVALATGDFKGALREAIIGACKIAGVDPNPVFRLLDRAGKAIGAILKDPVGFARNLFLSVGQGVKNFLGNIGTHLIQGVMGWLTGALPDVGITGPFSFTPVGIGRIVLQVLGVTYANIRARVIRRYPPAEKVIGAVEKGMGLVRTLIVKGPIALWGQITKAVGDVKALVLGAVGKFLSLAVLKEGITWLLSMLNPASALVKVVKAIFDLVMTVIERFQQIKSFVQTIWGAVASILAQKFKAVTKRVEDVLARGLPVVISLLAGVLGLGGLSARVAGVLKKVTAPVNRVIDKVTDRVIAFARKMVAKGKAGVKKVKRVAKKAVAKVKAFLWPEKKFSGGGQKHRLYLTRKGRKVMPMMQSTPQAIGDFLKAWRAGPLKHQTTNYAKANAKTQAIWDTRKAGLLAAEETHRTMEATALRIADTLLVQDGLKKEKSPDPNKVEQAEKALAQARREMLATQNTLATHLAAMMQTSDHLAKNTADRYKLEGLVAQFGSQPASAAFKVGGNRMTKFTADHMPRTLAFRTFKEKPYFAGPEGDKLRDVSKTYVSKGLTILLVESRHAEGRTYQSTSRSNAAKGELLTAITSLEQSQTDAAVLRRGAVNIMKLEASKDAARMRAVISPPETAAIWDDVDVFQDAEAKKVKNWKKVIVTNIKTQVERGLGQMERQSLEYLAGE